MSTIERSLQTNPRINAPSLGAEYATWFDPIKLFDLQFLRVGRGLEGYLYLNNRWAIIFWKTHRLCRWNEDAVLPPTNLQSRLLRESPPVTIGVAQLLQLGMMNKCLLGK